MSHHTRIQFSITAWYGKQFPSDCLIEHPDLEFYCDRQRAIPPHCPVEHNPSAHLPVQDFLRSDFPSHNHSLVLEAASECFSDNPPNEILASLAKRSIPPRKFIQDLASQFGQAILDRKRSIKDPLYHKSFLPFWVLTVWERLTELNLTKEKWTAATTWFERTSETLDPTTSATTRQHLTRIGWSAEITVGGERATALALPQLLANSLLDSAILDLMAGCIQVEVGYTGGLSHVHICGTVFTNTVTRLREKGAEPPDWFRERFIDPVQDGRWQMLYFPMFWSTCEHWVSVRVNFTTGRVSVGQSSQYLRSSTYLHPGQLTRAVLRNCCHWWASCWDGCRSCFIRHL